jgi:hypothetical protein
LSTITVQEDPVAEPAEPSADVGHTCAEPHPIAQLPFVPGTPLSPQVKQAIIRRYAVDRESMTAIATAIGCSYGAVHQVLTAAGAPKRPRGGSRKPATRTTPSTSGPTDRTGP